MILYECERLSARISQEQCQKNRKRVDNFANDVLAVNSCRGCSGLGAPVKIDVEGLSMAAKVCSVEGCVKRAQKAGKCKAHLNGTTPRRTRNPFVMPVPKSDPVTVIVAPAVSSHELHIVNLLELFKQKQADEFDCFVKQLDGITEPMARLRFAYERVC